jgi:hypothetical protein
VIEVVEYPVEVDELEGDEDRHSDVFREIGNCL